MDLQQFLEAKDKELAEKRKKEAVKAITDEERAPRAQPQQPRPVPARDRAISQPMLNDRLDKALGERDRLIKKERQLDIERQLSARTKNRERLLEKQPVRIIYDKRHALTPEQSREALERMTKIKVIEKEKEEKFTETRLKPHMKLALVATKTEIVQGNPAPENAFYGKDSGFDKIAIIDEQGRMIGSPMPIQEVADHYGQKSIMDALNNGDLDMGSAMVPEAYYHITSDGDEKTEYTLGGVFDLHQDKEKELALTVAALSQDGQGRPEIEQHTFISGPQGGPVEEKEPSLIEESIERTEHIVQTQVQERDEDSGELLHEWGSESSWTE